MAGNHSDYRFFFMVNGECITAVLACTFALVILNFKRLKC